MLTQTTALAWFPERSVNFYSVLSREINQTLCSLDVSPKQRSAFALRQSRLQNNRFKKWRTFQELGFRFIQPLKITLVKSTYPTGQHPKIPSISNTLISLGKTHIIASVHSRESRVPKFICHCYSRISFSFPNSASRAQILASNPVSLKPFPNPALYFGQIPDPGYTHPARTVKLSVCPHHHALVETRPVVRRPISALNP